MMDLALIFLATDLAIERQLQVTMEGLLAPDALHNQVGWAEICDSDRTDMEIIYDSCIKATLLKINNNQIPCSVFLRTKPDFRCELRYLDILLVTPPCRCQPQVCMVTEGTRVIVGANGAVGHSVQEVVTVGYKKEQGIV